MLAERAAPGAPGALVSYTHAVSDCESCLKKGENISVFLFVVCGQFMYMVLNKCVYCDIPLLFSQ